ncbi:MAG TPA: hypothetical protein VMY69_05990 [Phycisphaerae bacterium]|nr:hypothetical protein [Phycisphaerae bacterium]
MTNRERQLRIQQAVRKAREAWLRKNYGQQRELEALYRSVGADVRLEIVAAGDFDGQLRASRLDQLDRAINIRLGDLFARRDKLFEGAIIAAAASGSSRVRTVARLIPGVDVAAADLAIVNDRAVKWLWEFVAEDGIQLSPRLWKIDQGAKQRITEALRESIAQGEALHKTAENILRGADPAAVKTVEKAFGQQRVVRIGGDIEKLFTPRGRRNGVFNIERVLITETNRANGQAFAWTCRDAAGSVGMRWTLSSSHPRQDICDDLASAGGDGLGPGGYRFNNLPSFPAHPLCLCYWVPIFEWEVR